MVEKGNEMTRPRKPMGAYPVMTKERFIKDLFGQGRFCIIYLTRAYGRPTKEPRPVLMSRERVVDIKKARVILNPTLEQLREVVERMGMRWSA